jgi:transglutaminase-like putative cysteine protease
VRLLRPLPRSVTRAATVTILLAWAATMAALVNRSYVQASVNLATDLARYGKEAVWRGVYYRGEKIGFTVRQTVPWGDGFEIQEDGRLEMRLLGADSAAAIRTTARVDGAFELQSFDFSLDPGTGPIRISGALDGTRLTLTITSASGTRTDVRELDEKPALSLNLARRLASGGLTPGARHEWTMFDPATLRNAPVTVTVHGRELVRGGVAPMPAFRVDLEFAGMRTTSWITDTGEVVREESPLGLITVREPAELARAMAVPMGMQADLLRSAAVVPHSPYRIDDTRDVRRIRLRLGGVDLPGGVQGVGQIQDGSEIEIRHFDTLEASAVDADTSRYLASEAFIESDAPEIRAEAARAVEGVTGDRERAERLTRYVNGLLEKKPTVGLPSALEVLRTRVGDCNEHTALYVAMARAIGIPSRIAVGLTYIYGGFYYHAWPEVYLREGTDRGLWLPVDPTLNQFPADATHLRLARGGLDKQAAILPLIGRLTIAVTDLELAPGATRVLVGRQSPTVMPLEGARSQPRTWRRCP